MGLTLSTDKPDNENENEDQGNVYYGESASAITRPMEEVSCVCICCCYTILFYRPHS